VVLSTGMSVLNDISDAINVLVENGVEKEKITLLHCNSEYPTPMEDVNLLAMLTMKQTFDVNIGYSDHTLGIEIPIAATALGASVIEKHFTINNDMDGPDHKASLNPDELVAMVKAIRNIEKALGDGIKKVTVSEAKNKNIARKSIVAACEIKKGELFTEQNITVKRPGDGLSPMFWDNVIGSIAKKDFGTEEKIYL